MPAAVGEADEEIGLPGGAPLTLEPDRQSPSDLAGRQAHAGGAQRGDRGIGLHGQRGKSLRGGGVAWPVDPRGEQRFYLPPPELRYDGDVAVLVGPNCASACEYFTYNMTLENRSAIVGQYPTAGLGGGQKIFVMPPDVTLQFSVSRTEDNEGNIIIEGHGIAPTVRHSDYIASWLSVLRGDEKAIFRSASQASRAADFLLAFAGAEQ